MVRGEGDGEGGREEVEEGNVGVGRLGGGGGGGAL